MKIKRRIGLIIIILSFICIDCKLFAEDKFNPILFTTHSEFSINASSPNFPVNPVTNKLITKSALAVLTDELFSGKTNALVIRFFTELLTEEGKFDILNSHDGREFLRNKDQVILVLFIDKNNKIWQVNLTYVIPGTTVARTVAWKPEELKQFFSDYMYDGERLKLKSKGNYREPKSEKEAVNLTWDVNFDIPVFNKLNSKENK